MSLNRRHFLQAVTATGASFALTGGRAGSPATALGAPAAVLPGAPSAGQGTLVLITLDGGNDGLNTVIPIDDGRYRDGRGPLAIDPATAHALGDGFVLHPALAGCKGLWDEQRLAIVHGVGFDGLDRSHFHCMDVWQAASEHDHATGWLGRWLDAAGGDPLDAVAVGRSLPLALRGARRSAAVVPAGPFALPGDARLRSGFAAVCAPDGDRPALAALVAASGTDLLDVVDTVGPLLDGGPAAAADYGVEGETNGGLAKELDVVARLIEADVPARVYALRLGGFDTHANQLGTHEALLTELDTALAPFVARTADRSVTVLVYSEFGRRLAANGSLGTDHGKAGTVLLAGSVVPGFHGDPPPLDDLADGDLRTTVDFRAVYGGLLEGVLGFDPADVLDDAPRPLTLV